MVSVSSWEYPQWASHPDRDVGYVGWKPTVTTGDPQCPVDTTIGHGSAVKKCYPLVMSK